MAESRLSDASIAQVLYFNTDVDETEDDITAASTDIHYIEIDNTANGAKTFVKFYNTNTVTVGTTAPDMIIPVPASTKLIVPLMTELVFATAVTIAAVTTGGTAGTTGPTSAVIVRVAYTLN